MRTGTVISGIGHAGLILWLLFGGLLTSPNEAPPIQTADVTLLSSKQLDQMAAAASAPPAAPQTDVAAPKADTQDTAPAPTPKAEPAPAKPEPAPKPTPQPKADAKPDVPKKVPAPVKPEPVPPPPPPTPPKAVEPAPEPTPPAPPPKPAPRVAPTPAPAPAPDAKVADKVQQEVSKDAKAAPAKPQPPKEATAPKEAATQITPETRAPDAADNGATQSAPKTSPVPKPRPPVPAADSTATASALAAAATDSANSSDKGKPAAKADAAKADAAKPAKPAKEGTGGGMAAALAAAAAGDTGGGTAAQGKGKAASGPPLTSGDTSGLLSALQRTWIVDPGSASANVTVTVEFSLNPDGSVIYPSIKMVSSSGGSDTAVQVAFENARRAIVRGSQNGFSLPPDKYEQWKDIQMVFNPDGMRLK